MNLRTSEIAMLLATKSAEEWNAVVAKIKSVRGGAYPPDWWEKIKLSGLGDQIMRNWDKPQTFDINITSF